MNYLHNRCKGYHDSQLDRHIQLMMMLQGKLHCIHIEFRRIWAQVNMLCMGYQCILDYRHICYQVESKCSELENRIRDYKMDHLQRLSFASMKGKRREEKRGKITGENVAA